LYIYPMNRQIDLTWSGSFLDSGLASGMFSLTS
jgi:hypothetical protein